MRLISMKSMLLASAITAVSVPAFAADLPMAPPPPVEAPAYVPAFTWTGFYVGANAGYAFGQADIDEAVSEVDEADGFVGGGQVGYNYQFGNFVLGAEADLSYFGLEAEDGDFGLEANWLGTIRGRVGYAFDRLMVYGTGGVAFSDIGYAVPDTGDGDDDDDTQIGWTVGGGVEGMITENISAKLEYLYVNFSDEDQFGEETDLDAHVIRAGLNYKFSGF